MSCCLCRETVIALLKDGESVSSWCPGVNYTVVVSFFVCSVFSFLIFLFRWDLSRPLKLGFVETAQFVICGE